MLKYFLAAMSFGCFMNVTKAQPKTDLENLKARIESTLQQADGKFAVVFKDLRSGENIMINASRNDQCLMK